jgi:hypothetical protein
MTSVDSIQKALGEFDCLRIKMLSELAIEIIQKTAGDANRSRRELFMVPQPTKNTNTLRLPHRQRVAKEHSTVALSRRSLVQS